MKTIKLMRLVGKVVLPLLSFCFLGTYIQAQTVWYEKSGPFEWGSVFIADKNVVYYSDNQLTSVHESSGVLYRYHLPSNSLEAVFGTHDGSITEIYFFDKDTGFVGYQEGDFYFGNNFKFTDNAGDSWVERNFYSIFSTSLSFLNPNYGFLIFHPDNPPGGVIYKYELDTNYVVFESMLYKFYNSNSEAVNENTIFVTGLNFQDNAIVLRSTDAGENWSEVLFVENLEFNDVCFVNDSVGFCVGDSGRIYRTSDVGNSWDTILINSDKALYDIDFGNDLIGIVVGDGGSVYKSIDLGKTWEKVDFPNTNLLWQVKVFDNDECHIVDEDKRLYSNFYHFGVEEREIETIKIYPNPCQRLLNVSLPQNTSDVELSIYSLMGQKLITLKNERPIDVSELPKGVYILSIRFKDGIYNEKIIFN